MENKSNQKKFRDKEIFHETKNDPFTWSDIKHLQFEDDDRIEIVFVERYHSENNGWDDHFSCTVIRKVLETDEEFQERQKRIEEEMKLAKEERYKRYLKLKEEFDITTHEQFKH